ncbi:Adenine deaminase [Frankia canadensis]|uniref:adenine deaminase n=1 Tax=Frankia canadensis TaxID=1836972 RepID=A0A2I2KL92_9ACTN|nr:adenine deaminase C-terminal domain-containing protein [Frankia canadensis]SNQ46414.1 Adenine deaminase [Frankia canadensis]SOU53704.1 Adenine deaminase [Frankia canadensis]
MNVARTSRGPWLASTTRSTIPRRPPAVPDAGRPVPPAQPAGRPEPVERLAGAERLAGVERLVPSAVQVERLRRVARGDEDADLVVRGGLVMVVHDGSVVSRDILIVGRYIAAVTKPGVLGGRRSLDAAGRHVLPAYVDAGLRIEDTLLSPGELARLIVPHGTGTLLADSTALTALGGTRAVEFATGSATPLRILARAGRAPAGAGGGIGPSATGTNGLSALAAGAGDGLRQALASPVRAGIRTVAELATHGHVDHDVHLAVSQGTSPIEAIRRATLLPARAHGLEAVLGSIAPARLADLQVVAALADAAPPDVVVAGGRIAAERGRPLFENADPPPSWADGRVRLPADLHAGSFACPGGRDGSVAVASIDSAVPLPSPAAATLGPAAGTRPAAAARHQVRVARMAPTVRGEQVTADPTRDLQKVAVFSSQTGDGGSVEIGLLRGCGLVRGALGFTTGRDPGQVIIIGVRDDDMLTVARAIEGMGGGFAVVDQGWVRAACPLPLLGLMSDAPWEAVLGELVAVDTAATALGCTLPSPLRTLASLGRLLHTRP